MATSGSIDFSVTRDNVITDAMELLGALGSGESPSSDDLTSCSRTLNMMLKAWQATGMHLFTVQELWMLLQPSVNKYTFNGSDAKITASLTQTELTADASSSDTSLTVDSITGISSGDNIGVQVDDGTVHWTTVNGAPSGSTVVLTTGLDDDSASGNYVYAFTSFANAPKVIDKIVLVEDGGDTETDVELISRWEYADQAAKTADGQVNQAYFDRQHTNPVLYVWPECDNVRTYLRMWVQRTIDDMDAASDELDVPQEWYLAIVYNLAVLIAPKFGTSDARRKAIKDIAVYYYNLAEFYDREESVSFEPDVF